MSMSTSSSPADLAGASKTTAGAAEKTAVAFGVSAAITVLFNTVLAWVKDAYDPLNNFMAALTGHHWWTHGFFDIALFVILGWILASRSGDAHMSDRLVTTVVAAVVIAGFGLAGWFFLV